MTKAFLQTAASDRGPQHRGLHDSQEQHRHQLQGHEPHQLVRDHTRSAVRLLYCAILRPCAGPACSGSSGTLRSHRTLDYFETYHLLGFYM